MVSGGDEYLLCKGKTESLSRWTRKFRSKVGKVHKERRTDWRMVAVLAASKTRTEEALKLKQSERHAKWAKMQAEMEQRERRDRADQIDNLWKTDLKDLDSFFLAIDNVKIIPKDDRPEEPETET